jgi:voltage-gated potassium channel
MAISGRQLWIRLLDVLLFVATLAAVAVSFWEQAPGWAALLALVAFVVLFVARWWYSDDRNGFLRANWFDLVLIVLLSSPLLRLLAALKVAGLAPALKLGAFIRSNKDRLLKLVILSSDSYPAAMALIFGLVFIFGASAYLLEHSQNPAFAYISDGLWWAFVTLTTVGYGDIVPVTSGGRIIGVFTMVFGITVYSLMIANLTHFVEKTSRRREHLAEHVAAASSETVKAESGEIS